MVTFRSRRLEALLGGRLDSVTYAQVRSLVDTHAAEADDLDFKAALYGSGDSDKRALATDVAAMANTAGGLIVIGIQEDDQARASSVQNVSLADAEINRMLQIIASLTAPLPAFDVIPLECPDEGGVGFLLVAVPRSIRQPHAVLVNGALRYPRRNGSTTRYLTETEVATAYRERFTVAVAQAGRADEVERDLLTRLNTEGLPWLVVSLVPDLRGDFTVDTATLTAFRTEVVGSDPHIVPVGIQWTRARVGRRRLVADGTGTDDRAASRLAVELHSDGSGTFAAVVPDLNERDHPVLARSPERRMDDEHAVIAVMSGLRMLAQHARDRAATGGTALVRAQAYPLDPEKPVRFGHRRGFMSTGGSLGDLTLTGPMPPAEYSAPIDALADGGPDLAAAASILLTDIAQACGFPEVLQVTRDGQLRRRYWSNEMRPALDAWAKQTGVDIVDDEVQTG
jgi:hypothetical protein